MGQDTTVITLSKQEMIHLEMIVLDNDKDEALAFLRNLRSRIDAAAMKGMKSHLDC